MKHIVIAMLVLALTTPVIATAVDIRASAGGLARDDDQKVVQVGVDLAGFQPTYTAWLEQSAVSLLYTKRWEYFEVAGGPAYVKQDEGYEGGAGHVRVGPRAGPFFIVYEALFHDGRSSGFIMGGVQITIGH